MADVRITSGLPATPVATGRSEAVKAAQRAFFDAALNQAQAAAPTRRTAPTTQSASVAAGGGVFPSRATTDAPPTDGRIRRPGSLLDIKV